MRRSRSIKKWKKMSAKQKRSFMYKAKKSAKKRKAKSLKKEIEEDNEAVVFVFYKYNDDNKEWWSYKKLPKGWKWIGSGSTDSDKYPSEEQFNGPMNGREKMRELLKDKFSSLKEKGIVYQYKIQNSYKL